MRRFPDDLLRAGRSRFREALCLRDDDGGPRISGPGTYGPGISGPGTYGPSVSKPGNSEQGSAVVEFTFLSLLLMVPVVYFVVTIGQIQGGSFAVVGAADQAAKVYVMQKDTAHGKFAAEQAALLTLTDYGHPAQRATVDVACDRSDCLAAGTAVTVTVKLSVPLPMLPFGDALRLDAAVLDASATQIVGRSR